MRLKKNIAVSESGFIFDPTSGESFTLNPVAMDIISLLKQGKNDKEIQKSLSDLYDVDEATLEKDYFQFLFLLNSNQLLENE